MDFGFPLTFFEGGVAGTAISALIAGMLALTAGAASVTAGMLALTPGAAIVTAGAAIVAAGTAIVAAGGVTDRLALAFNSCILLLENMCVLFPKMF